MTQNWNSLRSIKGAFVRKSGKGAKEKYVASSVMVVQWRVKTFWNQVVGDIDVDRW